MYSSIQYLTPKQKVNFSTLKYTLLSKVCKLI